jgi:hypothetical protein
MQTVAESGHNAVEMYTNACQLDNNVFCSAYQSRGYVLTGLVGVRQIEEAYHDSTVLNPTANLRQDRFDRGGQCFRARAA